MSNESVRASMEPREEEEMFIRVNAPATLEEGYSFDVLVDGEPFTVHVPPGGVKEGEEFDVLYDRGPRYYDDASRNNEEEEEDDTYLSKDGDTLPARTLTMSEEDEEAIGDDEKTNKTWFDEETGAPIGRWRTSLCSCCDVITQSTFWIAMCCTPILVAQLINRFHLTWNGLAGDIQETQLSYNRILIGFIIALGLWKIPGLGDLIMTCYWMMVVVYIGTQVRAHVRQKYKIPTTLPTRCGKRLEDCCCMTFCGCCATIQMARHTHDDKEYPGLCCTTTGLGCDAPRIVESF
jgi:Cys-rich protein (TIGR01571 family)